MVLLVKRLLCKHEDLSFDSQQKLGVAENTCQLREGKAKTGGSPGPLASQSNQSNSVRLVRSCFKSKGEEPVLTQHLLCTMYVLYAEDISE